MGQTKKRNYDRYTLVILHHFGRLIFAFEIPAIIKFLDMGIIEGVS